MQKDVGSFRSFWNFLKEDREPILLGWACGSALSACIPQFLTIYPSLATWLSSPAHTQKLAVTFFSELLLSQDYCFGSFLFPSNGQGHGGRARTAVPLSSQPPAHS